MRPFRECFREMLVTLRPMRWKVALSCLFGLLEIALSLSFVWVSKHVVDIATGADASMGLGVAVLVFVSIMLGQALLGIVSRYWDGYIEVTARNRMRSEVFSKVMNSIWTGREKFHSGDTVNRLEEDIRVVVDFTVSSLPQIIVTVCRFVAATVFLFAMSAELGWILVFIMPVAVIGSRLFFRKTRFLTNEIRKGDSKVQAHMQENIQHRMVVRSMGGIDEVTLTLDDLQDDVQSKTISRLNYNAISRGFLQIGFMAGYAAAFIWSVYGLREGSVTYGMMTAFLQLVSQVQRPVSSFTQQIPAFIRALSSQDRLMDLTAMQQEDKAEPVLIPGAPGLRIRSLSFRYPDSEVPVFENLDFDFKPGSFTAVTGPTGIGKSTLVKVLMSILKPSSGTVELYDPPTPAGPATLCNFMYVPQGNSLMSGTIRQNLLLADPSASDDALWDVLDAAEAGFVRKLPDGLDSSCAEVGGGLSEGQAQRIAIARALLRPGGILVLDEASSALDEDTEARMLANIASRCGGSKTVICITHRPAAARNADFELSLS
ncbi:MAG: ABC transporter ATP-binding protein [Bacteroidales bacterium]|nr:ABC transporter ATP-binding protein [Bacteroidales bacterium]